MAAARGLVSLIASNASPWVAPHGATEGRFGTNPICVGFPSADEPVIWDIGTSAIMHAEVKLADALGQQLPEGVAFDAAGSPTRDPVAALEGAFAAWGGHKGSGLGIVVQLLGVLAGSPAIPPRARRIRHRGHRRASGPSDVGGRIQRATLPRTRNPYVARDRSRVARQCECRSTDPGRSVSVAWPKTRSRWRMLSMRGWSSSPPRMGTRSGFRLRAKRYADRSRTLRGTVATSERCSRGGRGHGRRAQAPAP